MPSSSIPNVSQKLTPTYPPPSTANPQESESPSTRSLIAALQLEKHIEGGYFAEIDRHPLTIPNPFDRQAGGDDDEGGKKTAEKPMSGDNSIRNASTSIYYFLTPTSPQGNFHRNAGRTVCFFLLSLSSFFFGSEALLLIKKYRFTL
jgi:hypothetical protein